MFHNHTLLDATRVPKIAAGATVQAWDPANTSLHVGLSGGGLTATGLTGAAAGDYTRGIISRTSGKIYWEVLLQTWAGAASPPDYVGAIGMVDQDGAALLPTIAAHCVGYFSDGQCYGTAISGNQPGGGVSYPGDGYLLCGAADLGAKLFWYRRGINNTEWHGVGGGTADPAAGTGGVDLTGMGPTFYPFIDIRVPGAVLIANFGATTYSGLLPNGTFLNWV